MFGAAVTASIHGTGAIDGPVVLAAAALTGVAVGRVLPFNRWRPTWIFGFAVLMVAAAVLAWDASSPVIASQLQRGLGATLVGLAALRGVVHGDPAAGDRAMGRLVRLGPFLLGAGWLFGLTIAGTARPAFIAAAFDASLLFIIAGALGLGAARLVSSARESRAAARADRSWLVLALVVGGATVVALPAAALVGIPLADRLTSALLGGVAVVGGAIFAVIGGLGAVAAGLVALLLGPIADQPTVRPSPSPSPFLAAAPPPQGGLPSGTEAPLDPAFGTLLILVAVAVLIAVAWYLAVRWQGSRRGAGGVIVVRERHSFDVDIDVRLPTPRLPARLRSLRPPRGAVEAYPRLLEDWADSDPRARRPAETPAGHSRRLRSEGRGDLGLDLLAADYEIARFGGAPLTDREEHRAVGRWRRLRRVLPGTGRRRPGAP